MAVKPKAKSNTTSTPRSSKNSKLADERHIGYETVDWGNVKASEYNAKFTETLRHYGYFYDTKDTFSWAADWVKKNMSKDDLKAFKASSDRLFSPTAGALCRMMSNGAVLSDKSMALVTDRIDNAIAQGKEGIAEKATDDLTTAVTSRRSPADIVKERTSEFIASIENILDTFNTDKFDDNADYSVYAELQKSDAPYNTAKSVADYYTPLVEELTELVENKTDDLVEAYSYMGVRKRKQLMLLVKSFVDDAEKYMNSKKAVRKPRKKKSISAGQQVSKVSYLKDSSEFKITSIDPVNIIGAQELYTFNVKYRQITRLVSSSSAGFGIKGTTILNIDEEGSTRKTVRKPQEFFNEFGKSTKAKAKKQVDALTTKTSPLNGRLNDQTIILKAFT